MSRAFFVDGDGLVLAVGGPWYSFGAADTELRWQK